MIYEPPRCVYIYALPDRAPFVCDALEDDAVHDVWRGGSHRYVHAQGGAERSGDSADEAIELAMQIDPRLLMPRSGDVPVEQASRSPYDLVELPRGLQRGEREALPGRRQIVTYKARVGESPSVYLHCGNFADGRLGEIFLLQSKVGTFARGMLEAFAITVSLGLQYGVPLEALCMRFKDSRFEPSGFVQGEDNDTGVTEAKSVIDWVFQVLQKEYPNQ